MHTQDASELEARDTGTMFTQTTIAIGCTITATLCLFAIAGLVALYLI
jgi:hypothetical protein